jgi:hypothetical protein
MKWIVLSALLVAACQSGGQQTWLPKLQADKPLSGPPAQMMEALSPLQFSGTILILTGAALLFVGLVALMAFLATVLASQVMVYALVAGLILAVVIAVLNFKEIRQWIKS